MLLRLKLFLWACKFSLGSDEHTVRIQIPTEYFITARNDPATSRVWPAPSDQSGSGASHLHRLQSHNDRGTGEVLLHVRDGLLWGWLFSASWVQHPEGELRSFDTAEFVDTALSI